jgi:hypothetical protein
MTQRITCKHLAHYLTQLNAESGAPADYMTTLPDGTRHTNPGHYCIDSAYGGYQLQRVCNESGGVAAPNGAGFASARDVLAQIQAALFVLRHLKGQP